MIIAIEVVIALIFSILAYIMFSVGIKNYESAGN